MAIIDYLSFSFSDSSLLGFSDLPLTDNTLFVEYDTTDNELQKHQQDRLNFELFGIYFNSVVQIDAPTSPINSLVNCLRDLAHIKLDFVYSTKGLYGYKKSVQIYHDKQTVGLIGYDGNRSTYVSLSGGGCALYDMKKLRDLLEFLDAKITRVDFAADFLEGCDELGTVRQLKDYYMNCREHPVAGEGFCLTPVLPTAHFNDDCGSGSGSTFYVGKKQNGKELCVYEKGKQLGDTESPWLRVEGRLYSRDRVIPIDCLLSPSSYLAAFYPCLAFIEPSGCSTRVEMCKKQTSISFDRLKHYAKLSYGKLIGYMDYHGYHDSDIVSELKQSGTPRRLDVAPVWGYDAVTRITQHDEHAHSLGLAFAEYSLNAVALVAALHCMLVALKHFPITAKTVLDADILRYRKFRRIGGLVTGFDAELLAEYGLTPYSNTGGTNFVF